MILKKIIIIFCFTLLFTGCSKQEITNISNDITTNIKTKSTEINDYTKNFIENNETRKEAKLDIAQDISQFIIEKNMKEINLKDAEKSYEGYKELVDNLNLAIDIINKHTDWKFTYLSKEKEAYNEFLKKVNKYAPIVEEYNNLILVSKNFERNNEQSANRVIEQSMKISVEFFLVFSPIVHITTFKSVGTLASSFGLTNLARVCSPCVSSIMSTSYWTGKTYVVDLGGDSMSNFFESFN